MNLFEMEKHHTKTLWLLALLLTFSTVVWAQGTPVTAVSYTHLDVYKRQAVLCTGFWSCNTLDLNDVGYGDGDRLKASSVKEILYGTADGCWKADYQGHEFYFQFHEDGTVTLDSDFLEMAVEGKTSFSAKGKEVALDIENCDVHLQNLGSEFVDTTRAIQFVLRTSLLRNSPPTGHISFRSVWSARNLCT